MRDSLADLIATCDLPRADRSCPLLAAIDNPPAPHRNSGRAVDEVLAALHDMDAVRLDPEGRIAVAYPFSAYPTRHRVRIDDRVDVYAMCAIDALGMSAMLGANTRIDSIDSPTAG